MTAEEFSRLLNKLDTSAGRLNVESNSLNDLIQNIETKLRTMNPGLEVVLAQPALTSKPWEERDGYNTISREGTHDEELGWAKVQDEWQLVVRRATYQVDNDGITFVGASQPVRLRDCSRRLRIEALKQLPGLVRQLLSETDEALSAIEDAKKFVQ